MPHTTCSRVIVNLGLSDMSEIHDCMLGWCLNDCGGTWQVTCQLKFTTQLASEGHATIVREHFLDQCKIV